MRYSSVFIVILHGLNICCAQEQVLSYDPATFTDQQQYSFPVELQQPQQQYETQAEQPQQQYETQAEQPHLVQFEEQPSQRAQFDEQPSEEDTHLDETDEALNYKYGFKVHDHHTSNFQERQEVREKGVIRGYYSLLEADGSIRLVTYTADKKGFRAMVARKVQQEEPRSLLPATAHDE